MTPVTSNGSRVGSRRSYGTGSIYYLRTGGYWVAKVTLADRRDVRRKRPTEQAARAALADLLIEFAGQLGYFYSDRPRAFWHGSREPAARSGMSARLRFTILSRDGFRCVYCGATATDDRLVVDHAISVLDGGTDQPANLLTACETCNLGKGSRSDAPPPRPRLTGA